MNADEIIGRPAVSHIYASGKAGRIAGTQNLVRGVPAQAHFKTRVAPEDIRQIHTHYIVYILFTESVPFCSGVRAGRIVPLIPLCQARTNTFLRASSNFVLYPGSHNLK